MLGPANNFPNFCNFIVSLSGMSKMSSTGLVDSTSGAVEGVREGGRKGREGGERGGNGGRKGGRGGEGWKEEGGKGWRVGGIERVCILSHLHPEGLVTCCCVRDCERYLRNLSPSLRRRYWKSEA